MWTFKKQFLKQKLFIENIVQIPEFDYAVFTYQFFDGLDLDTRTKIILPISVGMDTNAEYVGYGRMNSFPASITWSKTNIPSNVYLDFAGDNEGLGYESVFLNMKKIKQDFPTETNIKVDLRCAWYRTIGNIPVEVKATFYKNGLMQKSNFIYTNNTSTETVEFTTSSKTIRTKYQADSGRLLERFATFNYNTITGTGEFNLQDSSLAV